MTFRRAGPIPFTLRLVPALPPAGRPLPTEPTASVPSMCLAGLVPDASLAGHTSVVNLDLSTAQPAPGNGAAADFTAWPEFHNGEDSGRAGTRTCTQRRSGL